MKVVIDIPKEQYTTLNAKTQDDIVDVIDYGALIKAIENGTPLPEGQYDCRTINKVLQIIDNEFPSGEWKKDAWKTGWHDALVRVRWKVGLLVEGEKG